MGGVNGGPDTQLDIYSCQPNGEYDTPTGMNRFLEWERQPWPACRSHSYLIIDAVENMLAKYDFKLSNRYKMIMYEADDARALLRPGDDHFVKTTIPVVIVLVVLIFGVLLCAQNDSIVCRICASKDDSSNSQT